MEVGDLDKMLKFTEIPGQICHQILLGDLTQLFSCIFLSFFKSFAL